MKGEKILFVIMEGAFQSLKSKASILYQHYFGAICNGGNILDPGINYSSLHQDK